MYKARPLFHAGGEYVQISKLPGIQSEILNRYLTPRHKIKIDVYGEKLDDCISYSDYEHWFQLFNLKNFEIYFESRL